MAGMNYSIADLIRNEQEAVPEAWEYIDPSAVKVRTAAPKWTWVARVCHELPVGKCVMFPVPKGYPIERFMMNLRGSLSQARPTVHDRFTVRRSKFEDYVVVMKSGQWSKLYRSMESGEWLRSKDFVLDRGEQNRLVAEAA